ncbi:MAG: ParB N-terminal domain-containing protein [Planctomycetaceae bacterium]|nr:ParB N-terminal domain-containing protein [Planctomycetaceae bacterium]
MHFQSINIDELRPAPYNPRVKLKPGDKAWKKLERSLEEFDLVQPIVWNKRTGHVVGGHQRLEVLRHRGVLDVDCVVVDLPLDREKALNVTLNNAAVASDWDSDKLLDLVGELSTLPDFDATLTGFDNQELRDLLLMPDPEFQPSPSTNMDTDAATVQATLSIPQEDWESASEYLDDLLGNFPDVRLNLRKD